MSTMFALVSDQNTEEEVLLFHCIFSVVRASILQLEKCNLLILRMTRMSEGKNKKATKCL